MGLEEISTVEAIPANKEKILKLWKIAGLLFVVTVIEFIFAFTMGRSYLLYSIFIALTLVKAFYIIAEFMHLKHEAKVLMWSISLPTIFVIWLIIVLLNEATAIGG